MLSHLSELIARLKHLYRQQIEVDAELQVVEREILAIEGRPPAAGVKAGPGPKRRSTSKRPGITADMARPTLAAIRDVGGGQPTKRRAIAKRSSGSPTFLRRVLPAAAPAVAGLCRARRNRRLRRRQGGADGPVSRRFPPQQDKVRPTRAPTRGRPSSRHGGASMTICILTFLFSLPRCLFFGCKYPCSLKCDRANPSRHAHARSVGSFLKLTSSSAFVTRMCKGTSRRSGRLRRVGVPGPRFFRLSYHALILHIENSSSRALRASISMYMLFTWQRSQPPPSSSPSQRPASSAVVRSPSAAASVSAAACSSCRRRPATPPTPLTSPMRPARAPTSRRGASAASTSRGACSGSRGRVPRVERRQR